MSENGIRRFKATDQAVQSYDRGARSYISNVLNELGAEESAHREGLLRIAYEQTGIFFQIRATLRQRVLFTFIPYVHKLIYLLLTEGCDPDGRPYVELPDAAKPLYGGDTVTRILPGISEREANEMAMSFAKSCMNLMQKDILNRIISENIFTDSLDRAAKKSAIQG